MGPGRLRVGGAVPMPGGRSVAVRPEPVEGHPTACGRSATDFDVMWPLDTPRCRIGALGVGGAWGWPGGLPTPAGLQLHRLALIHGLKLGGVAINRKMLAQLAVDDPDGFAKVAEQAKEHLQAATA